MAHVDETIEGRLEPPIGLLGGQLARFHPISPERGLHADREAEIAGFRTGNRRNLAKNIGSIAKLQHHIRWLRVFHGRLNTCERMMIFLKHSPFQTSQETVFVTELEIHADLARW